MPLGSLNSRCFPLNTLWKVANLYTGVWHSDWHSKLCGEFVSKVMCAYNKKCLLSPFLTSSRCFFLHSPDCVWIPIPLLNHLRWEWNIVLKRVKIHKMYPAEVETFQQSHKVITHHSAGVAVGYIFITAGRNFQCQRSFHLEIETIGDLKDVRILTGNPELLLNIPSSAK